jgi:hypothetical protein
MRLKKEIRDLLKKVSLCRTHLKKKDFFTFKLNLHEIYTKIISIRAFLSVNGSVQQKETINNDTANSFLSFYEKEILPLNPDDVDLEPEFYFEVFEEEFSPFIPELKELLKALLIATIPTGHLSVSFSNTYKRALNKSAYKSNLSLVINTQNNIIDHLLKGGKAGDSVLTKTETGSRNLHAAIPAPLGDHRILYTYNPSTSVIVFLNIGTHKELGFGKG